MASHSHDLTISVYGHSSANPESVASLFGGNHVAQTNGSEDVAIFVINPNTGVDELTVANWGALDDFQTPRIIVVTELDSGEADFDDAVMIATRVFDQMITPYLVLHDEAGLPAALISLSDLQIIDYSTNPKTIKSSEEEHQTLVQEFRDEYLELLADSGDNAFEAGLLFPAIPLWVERGIGIDIVESYIKQLLI